MKKLNIGINYYCQKSKIIIGINQGYSTEYEVFTTDESTLLDGALNDGLGEIPLKIYKKLEEKGYLKKTRVRR